ncbi:hypothetical protein Tco_1011898, partial [Tanacetum coccineum]
MDDEPMWAADRVIASTPGSAITIPETTNEFDNKASHLTLLKGNQFDGRTKTDPHKHIHEFLRICDMFKYRDTENKAVHLMMFPLSLTREAKTFLDELRTAFISQFFPPALFDRLLREICNSNTDTDKIITRMDAMTIKMAAQYKEFQSRAKQPTPDLDDDDMLMSHEEEAKFMKTFSVRINVPLVDVLAGMANYGKFLKELISNKYKIEQISVAFLSDESSAMIQNKVPPELEDPGSFLIPFQDYALWDVIENGNSFRPTIRTTSNADGTSTSMIPGPVTTEEKAQKKNDVKERIRLLELLLDSTANLSDATVYAFLANQPNGSQLVHEDLEQIHEYETLGRVGFEVAVSFTEHESKKVFLENWECRGLRNQESMPRNQDSSRRTVNVEDTSSKAMVAIDGAGFDWSFMAEEEVTTNMALMAFSDSEVYNDKTYSNTYLKSFEALKTQLDKLRVEFNKSEFNLATYKRGLAFVEEKIIFYKKNKVMFCDQIAVLKRDASFKDSEINTLKIEIQKLKNEKESNRIKINKFENASKSLDKLIGSQISDNSKKSLEEFQQLEFEGYGPKASKSVCVDTSNEVKKT